MCNVEVFQVLGLEIVSAASKFCVQKQSVKPFWLKCFANQTGDFHSLQISLKLLTGTMMPCVRPNKKLMNTADRFSLSPAKLMPLKEA